MVNYDRLTCSIHSPILKQEGQNFLLILAELLGNDYFLIILSKSIL